MRSHRPDRRAGISVVAIVAIVAAVVLVGMCVLGIAAAMLMQGVAKSREAAKRIECSNHLRNLGFVMHKEESVSGVFPSEKKDPKGTPQSFYTLIIGDLDPTGRTPKAPSPDALKTFLCPSRRSPPDALGKRDYGYVTFSGGPSPGQAILDYPEGVTFRIIENGNGTSNTAVLSHLWMSPENYLGGDPTDVNWNASPPQNARTQAQPFPDTSPQGNTSSMGSPHPAVMPVLFADNHVTSLSYVGFGAQNWQNIWNVNNKTPIVFP